MSGAKLVIAIATAFLMACASGQATAEPFNLASTLEHNGYRAIALIKLPSGHEVVEVELNGQNGLFLLDSGAQGTVVNARWAEKFALVGEDHGGHDRIAGAGGHALMQRAAIRSLSIAGNTVSSEAVVIGNVEHALGMLSQIAGRDIHGIVGQDILSRHGGVIDIGSSTLYLRFD